MKRIHSLLFPAVVLACATGLLAGCAQKKTGEATPPATQSQPATSTPSTSPAETAPDSMMSPPDTMSTGDMGQG